eukprot:3987359-Amphidinium_carterae.1
MLLKAAVSSSGSTMNGWQTISRPYVAHSQVEVAGHACGMCPAIREIEYVTRVCDTPLQSQDYEECYA